jgi:outer membrane protein TolC
VVAVAAALMAFRLVPQQFFPSAERNQFVIDVWMPQGTRIEATDEAMKRIETLLGTRPDIVQYASFVGQSAPRFYYNVNPQQPDPAYGQLIVRTRSQGETPAIVEELSTDLARLVPEAMVVVKELQQGNVVEAPVEIRISGDDIATLKTLAADVEQIVGSVPYARFVHQDYYNDAFLADVGIDTELANRLGLTNATVAQTLAGDFDGLPVGVFWEGDRPVTIRLRLDAAERTSFDDVANAYVTSSLTHASVPLRSVATLTPAWESGRIVRRNGVRTITVRSFVTQGHYASELLNAIRPQLAALQLPSGYALTYGGEKSGQDETLPRMVTALGISLVAIFLVLLLQFRNIREPLVVMCSIPLMLPGAVLGLLLTRNVFGFTAFVGLISLCGIVVRNAIILVDYINEKMAEGHSVVQAATEAGQRRLRPIFLTTMAAAVGVTPMILSGSSLWSPLASVIAVGLIVSMFFTLLVVPVLYVLLCSHLKKGVAQATALGLILFLALAAPGRAAAETRILELQEAVNLALDQNSALKIARARVLESGHTEAAARADYFPHLSDNATLSVLSDNQVISIPAGSLGTVPGLGAFPQEKVDIDQGSDTPFLNTLTLRQPLTQLLKIRDAARIAAADKGISEADLRKSEVDVAFLAKQLYFGLLLARQHRSAAQAVIQAAEESLRESRDAETSGNTLPVTVTRARVKLLQARQEFLAAQIRISDLSTELSDLMGLPLDTEYELSYTRQGLEAPLPQESYLATAIAKNPGIQAAQKAVDKAASGVSAARHDYIPDIGLFGSYIHQDGVSFVKNDIGVAGLQMTWDIFEWGKKGDILGQRKMQLVQADENRNRLTRQVEVRVRKAYRQLEQTQKMLDVAQEALALQDERLHLGDNQLAAATITAAVHGQLVSDRENAAYNELQAYVGYCLAKAELERAVGNK